MLEDEECEEDARRLISRLERLLLLDGSCALLEKVVVVVAAEPL